MHAHVIRLPAGAGAGSMAPMNQKSNFAPLSPCVCNTLRRVTRAVTQLYDDVLRPSGLRVTQFSILATIARVGEANLRQLEDALALDQTTLTRGLGLLERDGLIERTPHPDGRIKALRLTSRGSKVLGSARPLWARAQADVLRELKPKAWADAQRRLARLLSVAVARRATGRGRSAGQPVGTPRRRVSVPRESHR